MRHRWGTPEILYPHEKEGKTPEEIRKLEFGRLREDGRDMILGDLRRGAITREMALRYVSAKEANATYIENLDEHMGVPGMPSTKEELEGRKELAEETRAVARGMQEAIEIFDKEKNR